jgi:UDP-glucose 4-epimerase
MFKNKVLLITGGTGSFGNAVLNRFIDSGLKEIRIFSRDEKKQEDMRKLYPSNKIKYLLGDVRDKSSIYSAMTGVDYVFHAAALKQVPSCEFYPLEALKTNVLGTENVIQVAIECNVHKVICLSTDKAVYPINAMGMSKALMEKVVVAKSRLIKNSTTTVCCTRYGNVMASRGSVIPLFVNQIVSGEAITVTDPNMTRFMMSLEDAVDLVLFAFENANNGDIFVQKSPGSTVKTLISALKEIFDSPNHIVKSIGTRHGEKVFEVLLSREEMVISEDLGEYYRVPMDNRDLNYVKFNAEGNEEITISEEYSSHNTYRLNQKELKTLILKLPYIKNKLKALTKAGN